MSKIDPKARSVLLETLEEHLYTRVRQALHREQADIIQANSIKCQNSQNAFHFKGIYYRHGPVVRGKEPVNQLHSELRPRMKAHLEQIARLEQEVSVVRGFFQNLLIRSDRLSDYLQILPTSLHGLVNKMAPYFYSGEGAFSQEETLQFIDQNQAYIDLLTTRMTYNLLQVTGV